MLQWKLFNGIALGLTETNTNSRMQLPITFTIIYYNNEKMGPLKSDHIKWLITLTMITAFTVEVLN